MKLLSEEIKKELQKELLDEKEVALLFALKESISPNSQFVKELKKKLTADNKYLTPSPWQIFFVHGRVLIGLVLLLVTTPLVFILVKNNSSLKTISPAGEKTLEQNPASIKDKNVETTQLKIMSAPSTPSFEKVRQKAQKESGISLDQITVTNYEEKIWPNTCLGLPKKSENCLTVETPGFLVKLQVGTSTIIYRTDKEESITLHQ